MPCTEQQLIEIGEAGFELLDHHILALGSHRTVIERRSVVVTCLCRLVGKGGIMWDVRSLGRPRMEIGTPPRN